MFSLFQIGETPSEPYHFQSHQKVNIYFKFMILCNIPETFFTDGIFEL